MPHVCLQKLFTEKQPVFVSQDMKFSRQIWPFIIADLGQSKVKRVLNVPLVSKLLMSTEVDLHYIELKIDLQDCGVKLTKELPNFNSLIQSPTQKPSFGVLNSGLENSTQTVANLYCVLGGTVFEPVLQ